MPAASEYGLAQEPDGESGRGLGDAHAQHLPRERIDAGADEDRTERAADAREDLPALGRTGSRDPAVIMTLDVKVAHLGGAPRPFPPAGGKGAQNQDGDQRELHHIDRHDYAPSPCRRSTWKRQPRKTVL